MATKEYYQLIEERYAKAIKRFKKRVPLMRELKISRQDIMAQRKALDDWRDLIMGKPNE